MADIGEPLRRIEVLPTTAPVLPPPKHPPQHRHHQNPPVAALRSGDSAGGLVGKDGAPAPPNRTHRGGLPNRSPLDTRAGGCVFAGIRAPRHGRFPRVGRAGADRRRDLGQDRQGSARAGRSGVGLVFCGGGHDPAVPCTLRGI
jgi:hypothetical protein